MLNISLLLWHFRQEYFFFVSFITYSFINISWDEMKSPQNKYHSYCYKRGVIRSFNTLDTIEKSDKKMKN